MDPKPDPGGPKNIRIRRIRIRNTDLAHYLKNDLHFNLEKVGIGALSFGLRLGDLHVLREVVDEVRVDRYSNFTLRKSA